jgi:hypothetical protein
VNVYFAGFCGFNFMFDWPCISVPPCNENQLESLFILSLFRQFNGFMSLTSSFDVKYRY